MPLGARRSAPWAGCWYMHYVLSPGRESTFQWGQIQTPQMPLFFICFHLQLAFHDLYNVFCFVNPLAPGAFWQKRHFLDILGILRLDIGRGQISFNLVKKSSATWQLAFLSTSIVFYDILARAYVEIKILFLPFLFRLFFSFCCSDWTLNGLACSKKLLSKSHRDGQILSWSSYV